MLKCKKTFLRKSKGITLIALIVTIIVILLLAGVAINTLSGENGVINRAIKAGEMSEVAAFKDEASVAYMDILSDEEKAQKGIYNVTIDEVITRLINAYNYDANRFTTLVNGDFELESTDTNETLQVLIGTPIVKSAITSPDATTNYIEIKGKYYEISIENGKIKVGEGLTEKPTSSGGSTLTVSSSNVDVVEGTKSAGANANNFLITITGKVATEEGEHETITISYGGKTSTINVEIKEVCTLDVSSEDTNKGTVTVSPNPLTGSSYIKGTQVTLTATPKAGTEYVFKGWYEGTDTTDSTKLIEGAESTYQFTLNESKTLTAKFGEDVIDNSGSLVDGFVDDLGTRATIYLYGNSQKQVSRSITTTVTGRPDGSIVENYKNQPKIVTPSYTTELTAEANYVAYTVNKNGTYTFSVTDGNTTTETKIKVRNIETFTAIETLASQENLSYAGGETKAYSYKGAAVPKGYYVDTNSGTDENPGLVITDKLVDENETTGYSAGNEWVWVPVDTDPTGTDRKFYVVGSGNVKGADTVTEQSPAVTYSKYGKLYSFSSARTRDTYGNFYPYGGNTTNYYGLNTLGTPAGTSGYREPSLLTDGTYGDEENITSIAKRDRTGNFSDGDIKAVATQYVTDYNNMVTSVEKYGGFYIGRYELANISGTAKEQPGASYTNETWFSLYNKCLNLNKTGTATETSMMYGSLWDATMQWLSSNYNVGYTGNTYSGYGNYYTKVVTVSNNTTTITVKGTNTSKKLTTGQTSYTRSNNIYDLSGNCFDWTQEALYAHYRVLRGGSFSSDYSNSTYSTFRDGDYPTGSLDNYSSRPQLYIK